MSTTKNPFSVTDVSCACGYLAESSAQTGSPFKFDSNLNEYYFEHHLSNGSVSKWIIHHCPMCGGVASRSLRGGLSVPVEEEEVQRLQRMIASIKMTDDIERVLGKPDLDQTVMPPAGHVVTEPGTNEPEKGPIRVMTYMRLSETADVQFAAFSNCRIESTIIPKSR